jgi:hypothetical protein
LVPLHPIVISILFHHYKELKESISEVEQIMMVEATATVNHKQVLKKKEERMEGHPQPL